MVRAERRGNTPGEVVIVFGPEISKIFLLKCVMVTNLRQMMLQSVNELTTVEGSDR